MSCSSRDSLRWKTAKRNCGKQKRSRDPESFGRRKDRASPNQPRPNHSVNAHRQRMPGHCRSSENQSAATIRYATRTIRPPSATNQTSHFERRRREKFIERRGDPPPPKCEAPKLCEPPPRPSASLKVPAPSSARTATM